MREFFKKLGTEYASKLFLVYWLRWMLSALVMLPFMEVFIISIFRCGSIFSWGKPLER